MTFPDKPPYYYVHGGQPKGFLHDRARDILSDAGISVVFAERPAKRALYEVSAARDPVCSLGWFRNGEREQFAQFSLPIYRDAPVRLLMTQRHAAELKSYRTLHALLQDTRLRLGVVEGFSYGEATDALLKAYENKVMRAPVTVRQLMQMVAHDQSSRFEAEGAG
ncbi:MAG TPA: transporter substrate-binding domain-containing protein, partial [Rhodocyclaceae bacterium]|nr:transporter substrate-binding domain-containing protein [Rhodocyclaceae bacterium]